MNITKKHINNLPAAFFRIVVLLLLMVTRVCGTLADDLSVYTNVTGYESYNHIFFNFKNNDPSLLPTSGDVRYREDYGLYNFSSGRRSVTFGNVRGKNARFQRKNA